MPEKITKKCKKCGEEKPLSEFRPNKRFADGRTARCIQCLQAGLTKKCVDCGTPISKNSTRCVNCAARMRYGRGDHNGMYTDDAQAKLREMAKTRHDRHPTKDSTREIKRQQAKDMWEAGIYGSEQHLSRVSEGLKRAAREGRIDREAISRRFRALWRGESGKRMRDIVTKCNSGPWSDERRAKILREGNHQWKGGVSFGEYGPEFNSELKLAVRQRDNFTCQLCGCPEGSKAHDIHHIDNRKGNNDMANLITLCMACHGKTCHNKEYWQELLEGKTKCEQY